MENVTTELQYLFIVLRHTEHLLCSYAFNLEIHDKNLKCAKLICVNCLFSSIHVSTQHSKNV